MVLKEEKRMLFIMDWGLYCYKVVLFNLKNLGATYQHLINKIFKNQIIHNMEVYDDDMLVKNYQVEQHVIYLKKTFCILRKFHIKLNLSMCTLGIESKSSLVFRLPTVPSR